MLQVGPAPKNVRGGGGRLENIGGGGVGVVKKCLGGCAKIIPGLRIQLSAWGI